MKHIILVIALVSYRLISFGQTASGNVNVNLSLANAISISFVSTGTETGGLLNISFGTLANYKNGITSATQQIKVQSNKTFNISVSSNSDYFTYSGTVSPAPLMPVNGVLALQASSNSTGGIINAAFRTTYGSISSTAKSLISGGSLGSNKTFKVKYKATPGFNYPQGTYTANIVYTATQP
jgi:hypothetical protein